MDNVKAGDAFLGKILDEKSAKSQGNGGESDARQLTSNRGLSVSAYEMTFPLLLLALPFVAHGFIHKSNLECEFEENPCNWKWNTTIPNGFRLTTGADVEEASRKSSWAYNGPFVDASNSSGGHFLYLKMPPGTQEVHVWSPKFAQTQKECQLYVWLNMANMEHGSFKVVIDSRRSWLVGDFPGNDRKTWEKYRIRIGRIQQEFRVILEVAPNSTTPSHLSMDNIRLVRCFPELPIFRTCPDNLFRCSRETDDLCINKTQICDIQQDCLNGADEKQGCEEVPKIGRCSFEDGWCGWSNSPLTAVKWTREVGVGYIPRITGPAFDHTFQNQSGVYLYVNMSETSSSLGASAILESSVMNPPPRYHTRPNSTYFMSCFVRFFYHQFGPHSGSLGLFLIEMDPIGEKTIPLFYTFGDKGDMWHRQVSAIPPNVTHKYYLQFEARKGLRARGDIAIDDVSMSPECFGLNVPEKEKEGYDYDNFSGFVSPTKATEVHADFVNKTVYLFTSCGARGRMGPSPENCSRAYNNTATKVSVLQDASLSGVQRWIVPEDKFYTIIAKGASGGLGFDGRGSSKGATAIGIAELSKGQSLYILVGQEGISGCRKTFAVTQHYTCGRTATTRRKPYSPIRELKNLDLLDGGGGGGGASFVYMWTKKQGRIPLVIGAGGGGLTGNTVDDGQQHGRGMDVNRLGVTGPEYGNNSAGAGGGWNELNTTWREVTGGSLIQGAVGGKACGINFNQLDNHGMGGFGGGGGGCATGGGGGGYAGGSASAGRRNGYGGFSYVAHNLVSRRTLGGSTMGRGAVTIIPAVQGCGCNYLCAALDEYRQSVKCICPGGWSLGDDDVSCHLQGAGQLIISEKFLTVFFAFLTILTFFCMFYFSYKRLRKNKKDRLQLKMMNESQLQLNRLRLASDSMMTEYNPNYEFGGGTYTIRDLNEVPRENLRLVKALGQGAFGEVYQGFYRCRTGDIIEMPVAVKTLPELSTNQAETDFLMEALIMSKFTHPNIVHFIGVCFDKHPRFIVLELLAGGDLKNFLRESRPKLERPSPLVMKDLLMCAIDVAKGCAYLEEHRFIHRDIAARNCLLTTKGPGRTVKIADFGMARDIYRADYYRKGGKAMLPIKWMPPEAFQDGIFTAKTDIWSFGILLWEVMSLGYMPYTGCGNREVMQLVISGGRLEPPVNCPAPVYAIMTKCWHPKPDERPSFKLILERLGYCLQDPEVLNAPLPVFNRLPSSERDSTIMRPEANSSDCLQIEGGSDYLEPNQGAPRHACHPHGVAAFAKNQDSWETSFAMPESQSTQPLLQQEGKLQLGSLGGRDRRSLTGALSLDAGALVKQPSIPYVNVKVPPNVGNVGDGGDSPFTISRHLINEAEISC